MKSSIGNADRPQTSIRRRLTGWYVGVLGITLLLLGTAVFALMRYALYDWLDDTLRERAAAIAASVDTARASSPINLSEYGSGEEAGDGLALLDGSGRPIQGFGVNPRWFVRSAAVASALQGRSDEGYPAGRAADRWRVAACPVLTGGRVRAVVVVARDLGELHAMLARLGFILLALVPVALGGAGLGGLALASRALKPVDEITRAAAEISHEELSKRLPVRTTDELGRLASTFNALIGRLESAFERQRQFTADASHELRTPLAVIRAIASQKLMQPRTVEEYQAALHQIDSASAYMARLVSYLLTLARADAGQVNLELEILDLSEFLRHVAAQVSETSGRTIPVASTAPVPVEADAVRLSSLFLNLLENSVKFTPPEGEIDVSVRSSGRSAEVAVRDTGAGISPRHLPHIFDRFYRADRARAREEGGAGLGLAIGKWIAEAHGGSLQVISSPGKGTTMIVCLPLAEEEATGVHSVPEFREVDSCGYCREGTEGRLLR